MLYTRVTNVFIQLRRDTINIMTGMFFGSSSIVVEILGVLRAISPLMLFPSLLSHRKQHKSFPPRIPLCPVISGPLPSPSTSNMGGWGRWMI